MNSHTHYVKIICEPDENEPYLLVKVHDRENKEYNETLCIPEEEMKKIKQDIKDIKLGLTLKNTDTQDPQIQKVIETRKCHPAMVDFYTSPEGNTYRWVMSRHECQDVIDTYERIQADLTKKIDEGFQMVISEYITREIQYKFNLIPCVGSENGCPEYTEGSQYCYRTYCPYVTE